LTPTTELDPRFSDPAATPVSWEETERLLADAALFLLTTVRADGRPHQTPLVAAWSEDALWFCTGAREQKFVNLATNQHVLLTTASAEWDRGIDVVFEGEAERVVDGDRLSRAAAGFGDKWDGRWRWVAGAGCFTDADGDGEALVFAVRPTRVFCHAKGDPFGMTRHRF
jgi:hypothetical protein